MRLQIAGRVYEAGEKPLIMGVVNVTPDSFSDGGQFMESKAAIEHALKLAEEGADLLDVGGESTRPGAESVSEQEELDRVLPVIEGIVSNCSSAVSIDTTKACVARSACDSGAVMINDISGLTFDPAMAMVAADTGASLCVMHIQGEPRTMQHRPTYTDVMAEVSDFLCRSIARAVDAGVDSQKIVIDPGVGFGKLLAHNLTLIRQCSELVEQVGRPALMGVSRKSFIGQLTGKTVTERLHGTSAAVAACVLNGAAIVRVHDVAAMRDVIDVASALR